MNMCLPDTSYATSSVILSVPFKDGNKILVLVARGRGSYMGRGTVAALAAALTVGSASVALPKSRTGTNAPQSESARAADRNDNFDWGWLGLLG